MQTPELEEEEPESESASESESEPESESESEPESEPVLVDSTVVLEVTVLVVDVASPELSDDPTGSASLDAHATSSTVATAI